MHLELAAQKRSESFIIKGGLKIQGRTSCLILDGIIRCFSDSEKTFPVLVLCFLLSVVGNSCFVAIKLLWRKILTADIDNQAQELLGAKIWYWKIVSRWRFKNW